MSDAARMWRMARRIRNERLLSVRLKIMVPILLLFIPGMAWGFADPDILLPGGHRPDTAMEILFYASLGVVFGATMCAVLLAFDGVSKDRASGMLELRLAQPMPRTQQADALVLGFLQAIVLPVLVLMILSIGLVGWRTGLWTTALESAVYIIATGLILLWYVLFALLASTAAREQGTAVAFGVGVWFLFTFLWALFTTMVAYASGVAVGEANDPTWIALEGRLDLLSPNGVYHHLLETQLPTVDRGIPSWQVWLAALGWTVLPWWWLRRRMNDLVP